MFYLAGGTVFIAMFVVAFIWDRRRNERAARAARASAENWRSAESCSICRHEYAPGELQYVHKWGSLCRGCETGQGA